MGWTCRFYDGEARAGDGTVLLSGIEVRSQGRHLNVLGTSVADSAAYVSGDLQEKIFLEQVRARNAIRPVVLLTLPGNIDAGGSTIHIDAIELSDGAPRGLAQVDAQRSKLTDLAAKGESFNGCGLEQSRLGECLSGVERTPYPGMEID